VFILRENIVQNRKRIYDCYAGMFPSFDAFTQTLDQTTENFECMVIDNTAKSNRLEDTVFWYKAEMRPNFRLGAPQFWVNNNAVSTSRDDEDNYDPNNIRKHKHHINVKKIL